MKVLSLFDGISCGQVALERAGVSVEKYYAAEIDKYAITITQANYPETLQLGDMTKWRDWDIDWGSIDLLTAGFPCQAWSLAGKQEGDNDPRGALVHDLIAIWRYIRELNPNLKFLFENVKMKKEFLEYINDLFGVEPILINSALVSAQNRNRYYWTNIGEEKHDLFGSNGVHVKQPEDKLILLKDIIINNVEAKHYVGEALQKNYQGGNQLNPEYKSQANTIHNSEGKSYTICAGTHGYANGYVDEKYFLSAKAEKYITNNDRIKKKFSAINGDKSLCVMSQYDQSKNGTFLCVDTNGRIDDKKTSTLTARYGKGVSNYGSDPYIANNQRIRKLTPVECERLQTLPDNYTNHVSDTQRYKAIGNGWTVDVIAHIYSYL